MTKEEYNKKVKEEEARHDTELNKIRIEYAISNNPFKVGDTIEDHIGKGIIQKVKVCYYGYEPSCVYECSNLTKSGSISKREPIRKIYQKNIKKS